MIVVESATLLSVALRVIGFHLRRHCSAQEVEFELYCHLRRHCSAQVLEADIHDFGSKSSVE